MILRVILGLIGNSYLRPKIRENLVVNSKKKCKLHLRLKFRLRKKSLSFCRSHAVRWAGQLHYLSFAMKISELCFHWLWAPERIKFKLAVFVYRTVHGTAPRHCTSVSVWSATPRVADITSRRRLRSSTSSVLVIPLSRLVTRRWSVICCCWPEALERSARGYYICAVSTSCFDESWIRTCFGNLTIRSFHNIHNVVDRGVLQAMWEELVGKVGHRDQLIIC